MQKNPNKLKILQLIIDNDLINEFDISDALFERSLTRIMQKECLNYKNKVKISL